MIGRLAWLSPVLIAVRSGRINRSYIGKYDLLSFAEEKHKPTSDSILLLNPHLNVRTFGGPYRIARAMPSARYGRRQQKHAGQILGDARVISVAFQITFSELFLPIKGLVLKNLAAICSLSSKNF